MKRTYLGKLQSEKATGVTPAALARLNAIRNELKKSEESIKSARKDTPLHMDLTEDRKHLLEKHREIVSEIESGKYVSEGETPESFQKEKMIQKIILNQTHEMLRNVQGIRGVDGHSAKVAVAMGISMGVEAGPAVSRANKILNGERVRELRDSEEAERLSKEIMDDILANGRDSRYYKKHVK